MALSSAAFAQDVIETEQADFIVETVAGGLEYPWSIAFLPSGEMLVTEREGRFEERRSTLVFDGEAGRPEHGQPARTLTPEYVDFGWCVS